jgi:predicted transcriptional regulator
MRIKFIQEIIDKKRTINEVADILSVSRQAVSKWISKYKIE